MKKQILLTLALILCLIVCACGDLKEDMGVDNSVGTPSINGSTIDDKTEPSNNQHSEEDTNVNNPVSTPTTVDNENEPSNNQSQASTKPRKFSKNATIEETILVDENDVKIIAKELTYSNYDVELALVIENNSDVDLSFVSNSVGYSCNSVNGYMVSEGYLNCDVAAGKKANDTIAISYDMLMLYGIFEIADIEIGFDISDDNYNHTYTGPRTIRTTEADSYDYEIPCYRENIAGNESQIAYNYSVRCFSDNIVYEENGLVIASQAVMENKDGESMLLLEVINNSNEVIDVSTANIEINGLLVCDSLWSYDSINPGKTAILDVDISSVLESEYCEIYGITDVGNVTLDVSFSDSGDNKVAETAKISVDIPGVESSFSMDGTEVYNDNGIRIISKGIVKDPFQYSNDLHILLLAENTSGKMLELYNVYGSLSVNDYMTSYSFYSITLEDGSCAVMDIRLWGAGLEEINISNISEIKNVEFAVSIRDCNYNEIDKATIVISAEQ